MLIINKEFQKGIGRWLMDDYTVVQCYAPTEGTQTDIKQAYYLQLSRVVTDSNKRDIKIVT
jgi:hypothetical protein